MNAWNGQPVDIPLFPPFSIPISISISLGICVCVCVCQRIEIVRWRCRLCVCNANDDNGKPDDKLRTENGYFSGWETRTRTRTLFRWIGWDICTMQRKWNQARCTPAPSPIASFRIHFIRVGFISSQVSQFCLLALGMYILTALPNHIFRRWIFESVCIVSSVSFHRQFVKEVNMLEAYLNRDRWLYTHVHCVCMGHRTTLYVDIYGSMNVALEMFVCLSV